MPDDELAPQGAYPTALAAKQLGLTPRAVRSLIRVGQLAAIKTPGTYLITAGEIERFLSSADRKAS